MTDATSSRAPGPCWTVVVAAGRGTRFGARLPKQFVVVGGRRLVDWSVEIAAANSDGVVVVMPPEGVHEPPQSMDTPVIVVAGGATRSASVRAGLAALPAAATHVLVHDAARPLASDAIYQRVIAALHQGADAVVPVVPVVDTLRWTDGSAADRSMLQAVQTPQGFDVDVLRRAHATGDDATDDAGLVAAAGGEVVAVAGERWNLKVTEPTDEVVVAALIERRT